jgi:Flp pilus assembly protein TadG
MLLQRLVRDRRASVAPAFALSIIPIFGLIGAGVDYSRASAAAAAVQAAVDSTALALSKDAPSLSPDQLQTNAAAYFNAVLNRPELQNVAVSVAYSTTGGSQIVINASGSISTLFMGMWPFNIATIDVAAKATSKWGTTRLRVALVLDNTGSMASDDKMTALKTASHNLLNLLQTAAKVPEDIYVSIIPFSKDVNVGTNKYQEPWIEWTDWNSKNGTCSKPSYTTQNSCTNHSGTWTPANHDTWTGCVMDRDQNYDTMNTAPGAGALFPAEQYGKCPVALMPLSTDWAALNAKIDEMTPVGTTNQTIGLAWGWQSLTAGTPLSAPAFDPNYEYKKVIILLTDGLNTQNRWSSSQSSVDARTEKACANFKAEANPPKVTNEIYTVLVMAGNSTLLQDCASDPSKYFNLTSADQIVTTFDTIGTALSKLRLAK